MPDTDTISYNDCSVLVFLAHFEQEETEITEKYRLLRSLRFLLFKIQVRLSTIMRFGGATRGTKPTHFTITRPFVLSLCLMWPFPSLARR